MPLEQFMEAGDYHFEVNGEVIKMIHDELPAVRWTCGGCCEDSCTIFYDREATEMMTECGFCGATNLVRNPAG